MSGSGANLPIAIRVEGGAAAEATFNAIAATGERAMQRVNTATTQAAASGGNLRNVLGQAGYQVQDFSVQVQGGTSALTALSQQGSQFLGIFGPTGALAGAVLTVGILAARFLELGKAQEEAKFAAEAYTRAMAASNEAMTTGAERSREQAATARREAYERLTLAMAIERETLARGNAAAGRIAEDNAAVAGGRAAPGMFSRADARNDAAARIAANAEAASQRLVALQVQITAMERQGIDLGQGQQGPDPLPRAPGLSALDRRRAQPSMDVHAVLAEGVRESAEAYNQFNEALNLNEAGLSAAQNALARYERDMQMLNTALLRGAITEDQFTVAVESGTLALGRQIDQIEQRGQRVNDFGREFGKTIGTALEDAAFKGGKLSDMLKALEQDLARLIFRQAVTAPLSNAITGATKGVDLSQLFNFGGGKAVGGPVSGGTTYLVGERGPELFTPDMGGNITPNHALGGAGQTINYTQHIAVDARGSDANTLARARIEAQAISQANIAQFADSIRQGGSAARLVGRR